MENLLETHKPLKLTQEKIEILNRPMKSKEITLIILKLSTKKKRKRKTLTQLASLQNCTKDF